MEALPWEQLPVSKTGIAELNTNDVDKPYQYERLIEPPFLYREGLQLTTETEERSET
jgi:hypothetical protein